MMKTRLATDTDSHPDIDSHIPGDSKSWESPDEVELVWRLFIQKFLVS